MARIHTLTPADVDQAAQLLADTFKTDPLMRMFFRDVLINPAEARLDLFRYSCLVRLELGWPLIGVMETGRVCGVACVSFPQQPDWPPSLERIYNELLERIGEASAQKLKQYGRLIDAHRPSEPHHYLAVLGVDPRDQGRGFSRLLLDEVHRLAAEHPCSTGVALDTENPDNVPLYKHFGYKLEAESALYGIKIWHFFRPASSVAA